MGSRAGPQSLRIYGLQSGEGRWAQIICVGNICGVFEPKVVQVTEGFVREDGNLAFLRITCCCLLHICVGN